MSKLTATWFTHTWKKGQRVVKIFHGIDGYREATLGTVYAYFARRTAGERGDRMTNIPELEKRIARLEKALAELLGELGGRINTAADMRRLAQRSESITSLLRKETL